MQLFVVVLVEVLEHSGLVFNRAVVEHAVALVVQPFTFRYTVLIRSDVLELEMTGVSVDDDALEYGGLVLHGGIADVATFLVVDPIARLQVLELEVAATACCNCSRPGR